MPDMHDFHNRGGSPGADDNWDPNRTQWIHPPERTVGWGSPVSALRSSGAVVATGFLAGAVIAGSMFFGAFFLSPAVNAPAPIAKSPEPRPQVIARALPTPDPAEVHVRTLPSPPPLEPTPFQPQSTQPPADPTPPLFHPATTAGVSSSPQVSPGERTRPQPMGWPSRTVPATSPTPAVAPAEHPAPLVTPPAGDVPKPAAPPSDTTSAGRGRLTAEGYEVFIPQSGVRATEPTRPAAEPAAPTTTPAVSAPASNPAIEPVETAEALPDPSHLRTQAERDAAWELRRRRVRERYQERQRGKAVP